MKQIILAFILLLVDSTFLPEAPNWDFDAQLQAYFAAETNRIMQKTEQELTHIEDWAAYREKARAELQEMLGLMPFPEKTPLKATITGVIEHEEFIVEKLHFQSLPGLYVTANLYIPKQLKEAVPAIIYVCGHATITKDGYNYGAKTHYQHHPAWFARNGYVCLVLDTLQLAEIEGIHHGLYRYDRWWWLARGYTPAGVEAWNGIRAIDYLQSRPEVKANKIGITGRSGGGATSWWVAALDDRIAAAVPVAGITDLTDHVINGCVEDHCDCMYIFNTYQWDYAKVAALVAPRPLLLSNTDRDPIFPIAGVFRIYQQLRQVYEQLDVPDHFALNVTAGPHQDVQELRIHAFRWFNHFLYEKDDLIEKTAVKLFTPEQLRVFETLPGDEVNTRIDEQFISLAPSADQILKEKTRKEANDQWLKNLREQVFGSWPEQPAFPKLEEIYSDKKQSFTLTTYGLKTDGQTYLPVFRIQAKGKKKGKKLQMVVLDDSNWEGWAERLAAVFPGAHFWKDKPSDAARAGELDESLAESEEIFLVSMRGSGPAAFTGDERKQVHIRRRYFLLGQSLHSMQTWDILQAIRAISETSLSGESATVNCSARGLTAAMLLYASLFVDKHLSLHMDDLPKTHDQGPFYLGIRRYMDLPAAILMAGDKHEMHR